MTPLAASPYPTPGTGIRPLRADAPTSPSPGPAGREANPDTPSFGAWLLQASGPPQADAAPPTRPVGSEAARRAQPSPAHPTHATQRPAQGPTAATRAPAGGPQSHAGSAPSTQETGTVEDTSADAHAAAADPARRAQATEPGDPAAAASAAPVDPLWAEGPESSAAAIGIDGQPASGARAGQQLTHAAAEAGGPGMPRASRPGMHESLEQAGAAALTEPGHADSARAARAARSAQVAQATATAQAPAATQVTQASQSPPGTGTDTGANASGTTGPASGNQAPPAPTGLPPTGIATPPPVGAALPFAAALGPGAEPAAAAGGAAPLFVLSPPLDSPTFAPALGLQLSVLARDGIEQARMQLNPEALGPVSVRLSLAGQQLELEFVAAHARTREALEQALPQLASALGDAGFTLTGGGVFQQPRHGREAQPHEPGLPGARRTSVSAADSSEPAAASLRPSAAPRGLVDLYA